MEAGPSQQGPRPLFGEAMVTNPRGDSVKVPFFKDTTVGDTMWVVPMLVFWQAVVQNPVMPRREWSVEAQPFMSRDASPSELARLHTMMYLSTSTTREMMVPLGNLIDCLEELSLRFHSLEATVRSLQGIHANSPGDVVAHSSVRGGFAQPQPCPLTEAQAQEVFSLQALHPEYFEEGTELMEELDAAYDFFMDPPVGAGLRHSIEAQTIDIWWNSAQQYLGFLKKHEGLEPSLVHIRDTTLLAKFFSFRQARGNGWNTLKMEFVNLGNWFPFLFSPGNGLPAVTPDVEDRARVPPQAVVLHVLGPPWQPQPGDLP